MRLALGAVVLAAVVLVASACGGSQTVSSSRLILRGTVQCTATLTTPVQVGDELGITFRFHNVSKRTVKVYLGAYGGYWVVVRSPDGTTYDTRVPLENERVPYFPPTPIPPGATKTETLHDLRVRWEGPLRITPGCGLTALRPVRVSATSPGVPASESAALSDVVAASGHLLDHCRPHTSRISVVGRIDPPSEVLARNAPPMQARCSVDLHRERGFYVAQVLILTPPDLRGVHVEQPYEALSGPGLPTGNTTGNTQAIAWQFVVTRRGATSVYSAEWDTTRSGGGILLDWTRTGSEWWGPNRGRCGDSGGGFGGVDGPDVYFVSACGR